MNDTPQQQQAWRCRGLLVLVPLFGLPVLVLAFSSAGCGQDTPPAAPPRERTEATSEQVHDFCGHCHAYPPPDSFSRADWPREVKQGYEFFEQSGLNLRVPSLEGVVKYYQKRAPEQLPLLPNENQSGPAPVCFRRHGYRVPNQPPSPVISNVNLVHLTDNRRLDILACDMRYGRVMLLRPYDKTPTWKTLATLHHPAHAEVIDLDGDGIKDIVVADLGSPVPTDDKVGRVVWLRGNRDGTFTPFTLLKGVGRVADVQAADFNGDGKLDLIVAVFGWRATGEIVYLENQTADWSRPTFVSHVVDERHGAIHVPVTDLNGDGKPDFVALISQEHETVVAFLNDGHGHFTRKTIYKGPHPAYGSSGIQLVDLNGDGKIDVLYTNGDIMDSPHRLKPYHSVQWLENRGSFPFVHHPLTRMYGVHRAVAADFQGKGKLDIVAVSFLPSSFFPRRKELRLDAAIYLEQTAPGKFVRHSLEKVSCNHVSCAAGDLFGDGKIHLVTGNFCLPTDPDIVPDAVTVWENLGPRAAKPSAQDRAD